MNGETAGRGWPRPDFRLDLRNQFRVIIEDMLFRVPLKREPVGTHRKVWV